MTIEPYINKIDYKVGDRFLICSDGLTDMVAIEMILEIMAESEDMRASAKNLMAAAHLPEAGCWWSISGQWSVVSSQWSVVSGQWSVVSV